MEHEQLEFLISQYLDGALSEDKQLALDARLASDADARALMEEYRALDAALKTQIPPVANLDWKRLQDHISRQVREIEIPEERTIPLFGRRFAPLALAASVFIAVGIAVSIYLSGSNVPRKPGTMVVELARPEPAPGSAVAEIRIGPSPTVSPTWRVAEGVVTTPSRVIWIASDVDAGQDSGGLIY